ncbi:MAG: TIGR01777 family oxidoreductase [Candidatus Kapaibacteriota bacterium]
MNIILVGGTGAIGRKIAQVLDKKGYKYYSFTRNIENSINVLPNAIGHIKFADNNINEQLNAVEKSDAIINLAGASIAGGLWTEKYKQEIYNSRIETTNKLAELLNKFPNDEKVFVSTSAIGIYGNQGDTILTEDSVAANTFLAKVCVDWEEASRKVNENIRVVNPRVGIVLDTKTGALPKLVLPFKFFAGGPIGTGRQWYSWIHIQDLANLYVKFIEAPNFKGVYNAVAPNPVIMNEFAKFIGKQLHRPSIFKVPEFAIKLILGESAEMVLASQRVSSKKLLDANFEFQFPELDLALKDLLN